MRFLIALILMFLILHYLIGDAIVLETVRAVELVRLACCCY